MKLNCTLEAMEKSTQQVTKNHTIKAMTLVEVLVALAIVAFVFSSLTKMTFDSLTRAKKLELQDKMRNYATEAVQVIYNQKDINWQSFSTILPPVQQLNQVSQAALQYAVVPGETTKLVAISQSECSFDSSPSDSGGQILKGNASSCFATLPEENGKKQLFGRIIRRTDVLPLNATQLPGRATIEVVVACVEGACTGRDFPPFTLELTIYRTGGTQ